MIKKPVVNKLRNLWNRNILGIVCHTQMCISIKYNILTINVEVRVVKIYT